MGTAVEERGEVIHPYITKRRTGREVAMVAGTGVQVWATAQSDQVFAKR